MWWLFIPVYSSMLLPSAWLIEVAPRPESPTSPAWRDALLPLLWLIPFLVYVQVLLGVMTG